MTLKQIANEFGMKAKDFANVLGFSRQALYKGEIGYIRRQAALEHLALLNEKMYQAEKEELERRLESRYKAIDALERLMKDGDGNADRDD